MSRPIDLDRNAANLLKRYADALDACDAVAARRREGGNGWQVAHQHAKDVKQAVELEMRAAGRELRDRHAQGVAA